MRLLPVAVLALSVLSFPPAVLAQPAPAAATTPAATRAMVMTLADKLAADFVIPEQGARYAAALRGKAAAGAYDGLSGAPLALRLTEDLQAVAPDGHLRVMFQGVGGGPQIVMAPPPGAAPPPPGAQPRMIRMQPPAAMEQARWLAPGIAFVRFNLFPGGPDATEAARQFMAAHADAKVIIFDLRAHMGGGLDEMDAIFPWLYSRPTRLVTMATRTSVDQAGGSPVADEPSLRRVPSDPATVNREHWVTPGPDKRLNDATVYVLTSGMSASAAEHFALALKASGRATLVGRKTYGANHFGGDQDLGGDYTVFIPVGRTFDPATGKDWEGTGVAPDVDVPAEDALTEALTRAGVAPDKAAALSAEVAPAMPMARPVA
jgi:hypothetical protein